MRKINKRLTFESSVQGRLLFEFSGAKLSRRKGEIRLLCVRLENCLFGFGLCFLRASRSSLFWRLGERVLSLAAHVVLPLSVVVLFHLLFPLRLVV